jgi:PAS domain S-box-containing protein
VVKKPTYEELETRVRALEGEARQLKQAEEALREGEDAPGEEIDHGSLIENSLTGIYIDQDEKIAFANKRFAQIYGYLKDELVGTESRRLVHPEDRALTDEMRKKRMRGQDAPSEYEARGLTKDQRTIWIYRRNTVIEFGGRPAILGNIVDITKQKETEEELRKTNEDLQSFLHAVSHDLKTPIISIQGFSSRLLKKFKGVLGEKGQEYVQRIMDSADRMEAIVSDLLALSMIGRVVSKFEHHDSLEMVTKVTSALQDRLKSKEVELSVAQNLPNIYCDGERVYQVFENLIVNAIKYSDGSTKPRIEIGYEDQGSFHQFHVKDNGIGIAPQFHRKIFEMFLRLNQIESEDGTGLGLPIVERIVAHHGGRVWVESEQGEGATFLFTLPKEAFQPRT